MLIFFVALISCVVLVLLLRGMAHRFGVVDNPGARKQHEHPTPVIGGLAMFVAVVLALYWCDAYTEKITLLMACAGGLVALGLLDDKYDLKVRMRMMIQVLLALLIILGAGGTITHLGALFGGADIHLGLLAVPVSLVAFVGGINAMNMIDGADGMAGKMAAITVLGVMVIFYLSGAMEPLALTWAMLGALIGFLFFNARWFVIRAWVFMGDAGSTWLGLVLGWFMAQVTRGEVSAEPALVLWLFGIPLIDTLAVMTRRLRNNKSPFSADHTHIHHVFQHNGLSVRRTVLTLSVLQLGLVGIGVCLYLIKAPAAVVFWGFAGLLFLYYKLISHYAGSRVS